MLTFESVKQRLERESPLSFLEFNYMILQVHRLGMPAAGPRGLASRRVDSSVASSAAGWRCSGFVLKWLGVRDRLTNHGAPFCRELVYRHVIGTLENRVDTS